MSTTRSSYSAATTRVAPFNLGRMLRGLRLDGRLRTNETPQALASYFVRQGITAKMKPGDAIDEPTLLMMLRASAAPDQKSIRLRSGTIPYLSSSHPEALSEKTLDAIARTCPAQARCSILCWISPPGRPARTYIQFGNLLVADNLPPWNANRARSSQALFHLLALLRRRTH